jgi:DNA-binding CsgD family transcriptional regulator
MITAAYDAAGPGGDWHAFLQTMVEATGVSVALMAHFGEDPSRPLVEDIVGLTPLWTQRFAERYAAVNPYTGAVGAARLTTGSMVHVDEVLPRKVAERTEFYSDFVRPSHTSLSSLVAIPVRDSSAYCGMALIRAADDSERLIDDARVPVRALLPHLKTALRLHQRLLSLEHVRDHLLGGFDRVGVAVLLCDAAGRIRESNGLAEALLRADDGLRERAGQLRAESPGVQQLLRQALRFATSLHVESPPGILRVPRPSSRRDYELRILPLPERYQRHRLLAPLALVTVAEPDRVADIDFGALARAYGFTRAEVRVLALVVEQHERKSIAQRLGIGEETVKTHLKALFQKTHTRGRAALVSWVLVSSARRR